MPHKYGEGIPLPDVIDPPETMSVTLCIPRNRDHSAAFFGALYELTMWNNWQRNGTQQGKEVAAVWMRYYLSWDRAMNDIECEDGMAKCCVPNPEIRRLNPETERPEISYDGGATWQASADDPQGAITLLPPLVRSGSPKSKCDAATNAIQHINELITATGENLTTAADVTGLAIAVAETILGLFLILISAGSLTAPVVAVATAIWAAATSVFALGIDGYNAYWTTDKQDLIFCKIVCNIGENGQFTEAQYQKFRSDVKAALPDSPAFDIVMTAINAGGAQGLSQMASYGNWATADCDSCSCLTCAQTFQLETAVFGGGIITERDETSVTIQSTNVGGSRQQIAIWTGDINKGCVTSAVIVVDGSYNQPLDGVPVGRAVAGGNIVFNVGGACCNTFITWKDDNQPYKLKYVFENCPE